MSPGHARSLHLLDDQAITVITKLAAWHSAVDQKDHVMALAPLQDEDLDPEQEALIDPFRRSGRDYAVFRTMLRHPAAMKAFLGWGQYVLSDANSLSPREREIVILRVGALRKCEYEFLRHAVIARGLGFSEAELRNIALGGKSAWREQELLLLGAVDELLNEGRVSPPLFVRLIETLGEHGALDLVWTVGQYSQVCMFLRTAEVALDKDIESDPLRVLFA